MRYVDIVLKPDGWFHGVDEYIFGDPAVAHGPIHHMNLLADGTAVVLYELSGDPDRIDEILAEHYEHAIAYQTSRTDEGTMVYAHVDPSDAVRELLAIPQEEGLVVDTPMVFAPDGGLRLTVVGEQDAIQEAVEGVPEAVSLVVESTGTYQPESRRVFGELTARQQEIVRIAVELGYYEEPRRATYEDVADHLDCTAATVGEHLRKIEATVLRAIVP